MSNFSMKVVVSNFHPRFFKLTTPFYLINRECVRFTNSNSFVKTFTAADKCVRFANSSRFENHFVPKRRFHSHVPAASKHSEETNQTQVVEEEADHFVPYKNVIQVTKPIHDYLLSHTREPEILCELRKETSKMIGREMQISPEQGQFLSMLVQITNAKKCIEIGVYTGYSALAVASVLPEDGSLVACDRVPSTLAIAKKYASMANLSHKIDFRLGIALDTLKTILENEGSETFDFAFIDADKRNYFEYYEYVLKLIKSGGLIVIDNVLWYGRVVDDNVVDKKTQYLRNFNDFLFQDDRVDISMVPIGDGMTLCRKK